MTMKFNEKEWSKVFKNISYIQFVTKVDVMDGSYKIAELSNDDDIMYVPYTSIRHKYGSGVEDDVRRIMGEIGQLYELKDIVYVKCDELELAKNSLASMARALVEIGLIGNVKTAYSGLVSNYQKDGYNFEYYGYRFEVITENEIY